MIEFERPKDQSSIIKVIGVGGGGGNAVNYMHGLGIDGVDFVVCNTDSQALMQSQIPNKIQLGPHLTQGLGAGANPEIGKQAGEESIEDITKILEVRTRMAFITAGMGGGTGTGAAPIIAKVCKDLDILTVGIVTTPFSVEGPKRMKQAKEGIEAMRENVDTILIISNDKLRQQFGNLPFSQAFAKADDILATAAKCITDLITDNGRVNLDFNDVQTVMKRGGVALLGSAQAGGEDRARTAVVEALNSPLLNDSEIEGAKWILLNVTSAVGDHELTLDELEVVQSYVQERAGNACDIILGMGHDPNLDEKISVTIIATGFQYHEISSELVPVRDLEPKKIVLSLDQKDSKEAEKVQQQEPKAEASDPMSPKLVENLPKKEEIVLPKEDIKLEIKNQPKQSLSFELPHNNNSSFSGSEQSNKSQQSLVSSSETEKHSKIELIIKDKPNDATFLEKKEDKETQNKLAGRELTEYELEEKKRFEEEKKAFEERADRLRKMSFNYHNQEKADEIEHVPAYQRQHVNFEKENDSSSDTFLSGYYVEDSKGGESKHTIIRTINTFLNGKRPD